jgi:thiamine pyrophosphokinase
VRGSATDPWNLHRVIPAKGGIVEAPRTSTALVFAGGEPVDAAIAARLPGPEGHEVPGPEGQQVIVVAADSGVEHALALGRRVDLVVGDLDSADPTAVDAAVAGGAEVRRYPAEKDQSDLEIALDAARACGSTHVIVVGGYGGRLDHFLANALLLASPAFSDMSIEAFVGEARITVVHDRARLTGAPGDLCSLLAVGGPARGVRTSGLRYPLHAEDLLPGSTRGLSNELAERVATVSLEHGTLLAVQPDIGGT